MNIIFDEDIKEEEDKFCEELQAYIIISKEVVGDKPLQLLGNPARGVQDVAVALSQIPDLPQGQTTLVIPACNNMSTLTFAEIV